MPEIKKIRKNGTDYTLADEAARAAAQDAREMAGYQADLVRMEMAHALAGKADAGASYTKAESDAAVAAVQETAQEAQSAAEQAHIDIAVETNARTIADAALKRSLDMLWRLNNGISYVFETDTAEAYSKAIPSGAVVGDVQSVGGKSVVFNQIITNPHEEKSTNIKGNYMRCEYRPDDSFYFKANRKYLLRCFAKTTDTGVSYSIGFSDNKLRTIFASAEIKESYTVLSAILTTPIDLSPGLCFVFVRVNGGSESSGILYTKNFNTFDLTAMFGAGNEPTAEQFEAMFPADYYPYTPPTIISADVESVEIIGKNLLDEQNYFSRIGMVLGIDGYYSGNVVNNVIVWENDVGVTGQLTLSYDIFDSVTQRQVLFAVEYSDGSKVLHYPWNGFADHVTTAQGKTVERIKQYYGSVGYYKMRNLCIQKGTSTTYHPYLSPKTIAINQAVRNLPMFGASAGSARNSIDFVRKKYIQCVKSVDLSTISWIKENNGFYRTNFTSSGARFSANVISEKYATARDLSEVDFVYENIGMTNLQATVLLRVKTQNLPISGTMYFELVNPIETDISEYIGNEFEDIECDDIGEIVFRQADGNRMPVSSGIEYIVSTRDAGGGA